MDKEFQKIAKNFAKKTKGKVAVVVKHLPTGKEFFFNEEELFIPASLLKIPVVLKILNQASKGKISLNKKIKVKVKDKVGGTGVLNHLSDNIEVTVGDLCYLAIALSDNTAANILIDLVGLDNINRFLRNLGAKNTEITHKFMLFKRKDSKTTAYDMMLLLEKIYKKEAPLSNYLINFLKEQKYRQRIPFYLKTETANKTADSPLPNSVVNDIGIVFASDSPYIICILTQNVASRTETSLETANLSREIFSFMVYKYNLSETLLEASRFILPVKNFKVNSYEFGENYTYDEVDWGKHLGSDFNVKAGANVYSIADGKVVLSEIYPGSKEKRNWGGIVVVAHKIKGKINFSLYGHLGKRYVKKDDFIKTGQKLGEVGKALTTENGWWEDEHLHFAIYKGSFDGSVLPGYSPPGKISDWKNPSLFLEKNLG